MKDYSSNAKFGASAEEARFSEGIGTWVFEKSSAARRPESQRPACACNPLHSRPKVVLTGPLPQRATSRMLRVLLIEDDDADARLVQHMLAKTGKVAFSVRRVSRLADAVTVLDEEPFDVVLLDLSLDDARGLATIRKLQATGTQVPVVVLTGLEDEAIAIEAMQTGAQDYLVKGQGGVDTVRRAIRYAIERKKSERELAHLALHDPLTGLGNRTLYGNQLDRALARARRGGHKMAVMFLDLDRFKGINDTLGHDVGDQLLRSVADRLRHCVRESDTVARLGGDEFAAVLEGLDHTESAVVVARKAHAALQRPFSIAGHALKVTPSIGIAVYPEGGADVEALTKNADTAMYEVKEQGRNGYRLYTGDMNEGALRRLQVEEGLRRAIERRELSLHFQPRVDVAAGTVIGAEALLRWESAELGSVSPEEFIPIAEQTELMGSIGEWLIRTACTQHKAWRDAGLPPVRISIKLSFRQFQSSDVKGFVADALVAADMAPHDLELEVTENQLAADAPNPLAQLAELKVMGVGIMVDHFARGYFSPRDLKRWPIDSLKLDRSYVQGVSGSAADAETALAIINLAQSLRLRIVVEGVETETQGDFVRTHGGVEAQGYLYGPAIPPDQFAAMLVSRSMSLCTKQVH